MKKALLTAAVLAFAAPVAGFAEGQVKKVKSTTSSQGPLVAIGLGGGITAATAVVGVVAAAAVVAAVEESDGTGS